MIKNLSFFILMALLVAGCATGRNYQPDINSLNSKISNLQGQLDAKNREIAALQDANRAATTQLELANRAKADAESRLYQALDKLARKSGKGDGSKSVSEEGYIK